jgi:hypothetical protein
MEKVGTLKVSQVKEKISYCEPLDGAGKIEKGMTIQPAN